MSNQIVHTIRTRLPLWLAPYIILMMDVVANLIAYNFSLRSTVIGFGFSIYYEILLLLGIQAVWGIVLVLSNLYSGDPTMSRFGEVQTLIKVTFSVVVMAVFIDALFPQEYSLRAGLLFKYWLVFILIALPLRMNFRTFQKYLLRKGIGRRRTIIVGLNSRGIRAEQDILEHDQQGFDVIGFVRSQDDPENIPSQSISKLGDEKDLKNIIREHQVTDVVLALDNPEHARLMTVINNINGTPVSVKIVPDLYEIISGLARTQQLYGLPLLDVNPSLDTLYYHYLKKIFDFIAGTIGMIVIAPIWLIVSIMIKIDSPGPILYRQTRVGHKNREFTIYKFRSMVDDAEKLTGPVWAAEEDNRVTSVGKMMRRFRLDEIPQLINVVKGEMSLVGPRPERPYFVDKLIQEYPFYYRRHRVRPGLTGWAQVKRPYDTDIEDVRQKLKYDFFYIESLSFTLDLIIILNTIWVVFSGKGR